MFMKQKNHRAWRGNITLWTKKRFETTVSSKQLELVKDKRPHIYFCVHKYSQIITVL